MLLLQALTPTVSDSKIRPITNIILLSVLLKSLQQEAGAWQSSERLSLASPNPRAERQGSSVPQHTSVSADDASAVRI